jgi:16S rRNA G966 N2-methylase RsmD
MSKTRKHKIGKKLTKQVLPKLTKNQITKKLYPQTYNEIITDYDKLKNLNCEKIDLGSKAGSKFVDYFTAYHRLDTKSYRKFSFFDLYENFNEYYNSKYYIHNGINSAFKGKFFKDKDDMVYKLKSFYNLYLGNIGLFKPALVKDIICKYKPKKFLDFTMGWGGRLVAACSENIESYIGIDINSNMKPRYDKMVKTLRDLSTTKIKLYFKDALKVDYSKLDYDFVFTSPPYYNKEIYNKNDAISKEEWNNNFYIPIFEATYKYMKKGGTYCLNIPIYIYEDVAVKVLGKYDEKLPLEKPRRTGDDTYKEYIYVWKKK